MRVVLLNQYYLPAEAPTALLLADVAGSLADAGHDVRVVCSRRSYTDPSRLYAARDEIGGVTVRRTWITGWGRGSRIGRLVDYLTFLAGACRLLLTQARPHVMVALTTPPMLASLVALVSRVRRTRMVYWVMDLYPELAFELGMMEAKSVAGRLLLRLARWTVRRADRVVVLGETMARRLPGARGDRTVVIHNWADGSAIRPRPPAGHALRAERGWDGRFVALYSGNLGLAHEFDTILDAAEFLAARPTVLVAFVGDGPRRAEVEFEARRRGLANVEFWPYLPQEDLALGLTSGDVHLVTLRQGVEGLLVPSKIYGILAAGRPTVYVGPPDGEVADILRAGRCGARVAPGDAAGLAREILRYADTPSLREDAGRRARRLFEERFDKAAAVRRFVTVLEECV